MNEKILITAFRIILRYLIKPFWGPPFNVKFQRYWASMFEPFTGNIPPGTEIIDSSLDSIPVRIFRHEDFRNTGHAILYLHGGAFVLGSPESHKGLISHLAAVSEAEIFAIDYRLAPEHKYPSQLEDALNAYRAIIKKGYEPGKLAIAGDSAGGGLAMLTALALKEKGEHLPAAMVLFSPWVDYSLNGKSLTDPAVKDPFLNKKRLEQALDYVGRESITSVLPLDQNLSQMPPMLIQVGTDEILWSDSKRLAEAAEASGVKVEFQQFKDMWHVFQLQAGALSVSDEALSKAGEFLKNRWKNENLKSDIIQINDKSAFNKTLSK